MVLDLTGLAYLGAAAAFAWVAASTWRRRVHNPTVAGSLVAVMVGLGGSAIADACAMLTTRESTAAIASLAIVPGTGLASGAFACLGYAILRPQWVPRARLVVFLGVEPVLIAGAVATNPWHLAVFSGPGAADLRQRQRAGPRRGACRQRRARRHRLPSGRAGLLSLDDS